MEIVKNPALLWGGNTIYNDGVPIEPPRHWSIKWESASKPVSVIHIAERTQLGGVGLELSFRQQAYVRLEQHVQIPAGLHYVNVRMFNDTQWGDDLWAQGVRVELDAGSMVYPAETVWMQRHKGEQSFSVALDFGRTVSGMLRFVYFAKHGDVSGALKLHRIDINDNAIHTTKGQIIIPALSPPTPEPPPTLPEQPEPEPDAITGALIAWLEASIASQQQLLEALRK